MVPRKHLKKCARIFAVFSSLMTMFSLSPMRASGVTWQKIGLAGGSCQVVAVQGEGAFAGMGPKLMAFNTANPANPLVLGTSAPFSDDIRDVALVDNVVYVAAGDAGMGIVDAGNTSNLSTLSIWDSMGYAEGIAVRGTTVYLADGPAGLRILDASDPFQVREISTTFSFDYTLAVALWGDHAYIAGAGAGLLIADVTDPEHPLEVGRFETGGYTYGVSITGGILCTADAWGGIHLYDLSNPALPILLGSHSTPGWALHVTAGQGKAYVADGADGIRILDISNPAGIQEIAAYRDVGFSRRTAVSGNILYLADTSRGMQIINSSDPATPVRIGGYAEIAEARWVAVKENYAFIAGGKSGNMHILDVSNPADPRPVSLFKGGGYASGVFLSGNYAYLTTFESTPNYVWVINIADPANPVLTGAIRVADLDPINGAAREAALQEGFLYVADEFGMRIADLRVPGDIAIIGQIQLDDGGQATIGVAVSGPYAFVAGAVSGVHIVDVSNPVSPQRIVTFQTAGFNTAVAVSGNRLFAGNGDGTVQVIDVSNPSIPQELGRYRTPGPVYGLTPVDNELFVSDGGSGLQILDISDPAAIKLSAVLDTPGDARQSALTGDFLYVAAGAGGLVIFQRKDDDPQGDTAAGEDNALLLSSSPLRLPSSSGDSTCTVVTPADSGDGSLRSCLQNASAGAVITFSATVFPPNSPAKIYVESPLPPLAAGLMTIDASTAGVILEGNETVAYGIKVVSSGNLIRGLQIANFSAGDGLLIDYGGHSSRIEGNVFNGNRNGIRILYASHVILTGNRIGTDAGGTLARGNEWGIVLCDEATFTRIGGLTEAERNIISGNTRTGVDLMFGSCAWNEVIGNYIGTDITGSTAIPNGFSGVVVEMGARNNRIGGSTEAERNIISGNTHMGIILSDSQSVQNSITGNYIGTNAAGTAAIPNGGGILVFGPGFNRIGGSQPGEGNLISGNREKGISIGGITAQDVVMLGNRIGTDVLGNPTLGNSMSGVFFYEGVRHNLLGGTGESQRNIIRGNYNGVEIDQAGTRHNMIVGNLLGNSSSGGICISGFAEHNYAVRNDITANATGIIVRQGSFNTLRANAVTGNYVTGIRLDDGGNAMIPAPEITTCGKGLVFGSAKPGSLVDIFSDMGSQGAIYEGSTKTDLLGYFAFCRRGVMSGPNVTATVTDHRGNSSGFSAPRAFSTGFPGDVTVNGDITLADAILALRIMAEVDIGGDNPVIPSSADINGDNRIGLEEALYILQMAGEMRCSFSY